MGVSTAPTPNQRSLVSPFSILTAIVYAAVFVALTYFSAHDLSHRGFCADVGGRGVLDARASVAATLPFPVFQLCSDVTLGLLLMMFFGLSVAAWFAMMRFRTPPSALVPCLTVAVLSAALFPYIPTTDPYAYALYGYEAKNGSSPYVNFESDTHRVDAPLTDLYRLFPPGSSDRTANYGPLAVMEYQALAFAAPHSLRYFVLGTRLLNLFLVVVVACCCVILRAPGTPKTAAALVAFHPIIIVESIAFVHTDILMLALRCAAFIAYRKSAVATSAVLYNDLLVNSEGAMTIRQRSFVWRSCAMFFIAFSLVLQSAQAQSTSVRTAPVPSGAPNPPPATTANEVPTIGGNQYKHTVVRVGPVFSGVRFSLTTDRASVRAGTPPIVDLWLSSATGKDETVCFTSFFKNLRFTVVDAIGVAVPSRPEPLSGQLVYQQRCNLPYFVQWRYPVNLNDYVAITRAGTYRIYATLMVFGMGPVPRAEQAMRSNTILLHVLP